MCFLMNRNFCRSKRLTFYSLGTICEEKQDYSMCHRSAALLDVNELLLLLAMRKSLKILLIENISNYTCYCSLPALRILYLVDHQKLALPSGIRLHALTLCSLGQLIAANFFSTFANLMFHQIGPSFPSEGEGSSYSNCFSLVLALLEASMCHATI